MNWEWQKFWVSSCVSVSDVYILVFHVPTGTHLEQWIYLPVQWPSDQISVVGWDHERPGKSYQRQHGRNGNQGEIDWWNVDYLEELSHHI